MHAGIRDPPSRSRGPRGRGSDSRAGDADVDMRGRCMTETSEATKKGKAPALRAPRARDMALLQRCDGL